MEILKKSHTVVLDPREGEYCWRKRATLQARVERVFLLQMLEQGYQTELLKKIDESLLAKVERLEPPLLLEYLDAHLNEERYYQDCLCYARDRRQIFITPRRLYVIILRTFVIQPSTVVKLTIVESGSRRSAFRSQHEGDYKLPALYCLVRSHCHKWRW